MTTPGSCGCRTERALSQALRRGEQDLIIYCPTHAAAPDLLAALEKIAGPSGDPLFDNDPAVEWRRNEARAAIAQAKENAER